ncbi:MAG: chorismate mutase [Halioglobus sp.]|nr:chorismate mutase [Halioglobus sp.]
MSTPSRPNTDKDTLFYLLKERLASMGVIARYKFDKNLPIEDLHRENRLRHSAKEIATLNGLNADSVEALFVTQMTIEKEVQQRHLQTLIVQAPAKADTSNLREHRRLTLTALVNDIVAVLAKSLAMTQGPAERDWPDFQKTIDAIHVTENAKRRLFNALLHVRLTAYPPAGFVDVKALIPDIVVDLRYLGKNNFIGRPIAGYLGERLLLSREAATALQAAQDELKAFGLGLKVFDSYRPQQAVNDFVRWAEDLDDQAMKSIFYPDVMKSKLFEDGYIAKRSSHTRGSTVDLTIVNLSSGNHNNELDMGSAFDFFSPLSWSMDETINASQRAHRMLLRTLMLKHGFEPYAQEWWHFTLKNEPFPDTYFHIPIR